MAIDADPVVPAETSAPNAEVQAPRGRAVPVERPSSCRSTRKPYEVCFMSLSLYSNFLTLAEGRFS